MNRRGFTLVELLVATGIVALLVGILLPALNNARQAAARVRTSSDLRQLLLGYMQYTMDSRGAVPFGYPPPTVNGVVLTVALTDGTVVGGVTAQRYPWRLVKYVDRIWPILHSHDGVPEDDYLKGVTPTFGLNTVFLGGQAGPIFKGFIGPNDDTPNTGSHVVFRINEVRRPAELIVFAECQAKNSPLTAPQAGLHYLTPPRAAGERWKVVDGQFVITSKMITGLPQGRNGQRTVVGTLDGHVEERLPGELTDMRLWAAHADSPDYDIP
jgi:prepilin-type N-terminal cleavage/methylation domain-containing protein